MKRSKSILIIIAVMVWGGVCTSIGAQSTPVTSSAPTPCTVADSACDCAPGHVRAAKSADAPKSPCILYIAAPEQKPLTRTWEYGALLQGGVGLEDRTDFSFFMVGGHLGKVLTPELGEGFLRGDFEYAVEVFPFWQSYTPKFQRLNCTVEATPVSGGLPGGPVYSCTPPFTVGGTFTGVSITPIQMRWNFTHGKRFMPWVQAAGGVVWTNHKYPAVGNLVSTDPTQTGPNADTSVWNFTPQGGIGAHYFLKPQRSVDFSVNGVHISSASLGDKNPGVNVSLQLSVGYTWWK